MDNVSRSHKTILEMDAMKYNTGIKDSLFTVSAIQRGKNKMRFIRLAVLFFFLYLDCKCGMGSTGLFHNRQS